MSTWRLFIGVVVVLAILTGGLLGIIAIVSLQTKQLEAESIRLSEETRLIQFKEEMAQQEEAAIQALNKRLKLESDTAKEREEFALSLEREKAKIEADRIKGLQDLEKAKQDAIVAKQEQKALEAEKAAKDKRYSELKEKQRLVDHKNILGMKKRFESYQYSYLPATKAQRQLEIDTAVKKYKEDYGMEWKEKFE